MRMKRCAVLLALLLLLAVMLSGCAQKEEEPTAESLYRDAIALLQQGQYAEAGKAFEGLGHYYDASRYAMYCSALASAESGSYELAASTMQALSGFMDSGIQAVYWTGRAYEETELYESALDQYSRILQYGDAGTRAAALPGKILDRDYKAACALEESKSYRAAISAFEALDGYLDSADHIASIRGTMQKEADEKAYAEADRLEAAGKLEEAAEAFRALGEYSDSAARAAAAGEKILDRDYQKAVKLEEADDLVSAYEGYQKLGDYLDAAARAAGIREEAAYRSAFADVIGGKYAGARSAYLELGDYKDSAEKARLLGVCELAEETAPLNSGIVSFKLQDRWGYIDLNNNYDLAPAYRSIGRFSERTDLSVVSVADGSYFCLINRQGRIVNGTGYLAIREGENGFYTAVESRGKYAYRFVLLGPDGAERSRWLTLGMSRNTDPDSRYNDYALYGPSFTNGVMIGVDTDGLYGLVNDRGETVISGARDIFLASRKTPNDTVLVRRGGGWQITAPDGTALGEGLWADLLDFADGYAAVCDFDGRWGYVSAEDCRVAIEPQYQSAAAFSEGLAAVHVNDLWGYIDAENHMVIEPAYDAAGAFSGSRAVVRKGYVGWQVIDRTGKLLYFRQNAYLAADNMDQVGRYEDAIAGFEALDGYADSAERALRSREKINSSVYAQAEALEAEGKYIEAADAFEWLGDYSDAPQRAAAARETQAAVTYAQAGELEKKGDLEGAIAVYLTLGEYRGSAQHAADLRESINRGICAKADELEAAGSFESAIRTLKRIPDYEGVAEHIASLEEKIRVRDYNAAAALEDEGRFEEAIIAFAAMGDYSDSKERITVIEEKARRRDYNAAAALEAEGRVEEAIAAFAAMGDYDDSAERIETIKGKILQREYDAAAALEADGNFADAYAAFIALGDYGDSAARAVAVTEKAEEQKRQMAYAAAEEAEKQGRLEEAAAGFEALKDYGDAAARLANVQEQIRARDYEAAQKALNDEDYAGAADRFTALGNYKDSAELLKQAKTGQEYQAAVADALAGNLSEAYSRFTALGDYKDSAKKAEICGNLSRASSLREIVPGVLIYDFHQLWGIANLNTNVITAAKYTEITNNADRNYVNYGLLRVYLKGSSEGENKYGYIDHDGSEIIPCRYVLITDFSPEGLCSVGEWKERNKVYYGIYGSAGNTVTAPQWRTMGSSLNNDWTYSSYYPSDHVIQKPSFSEGRMMVQEPGGKWGFIDEQGRILGEVKWDSIGDFSDGMAMVSSGQKYGFVNKQGQQVGEVRWDQVNAFSNGLAAVRENGLWGFINKSNELVIPCRYTEVASFREDGTCDVKTTEGTWQVINTAGEVSFF